MHTISPARLLFVLVVLSLAASPVVAQDLATVGGHTDLSSLPDSGSSDWTRVGTAHVLVYEGLLVLNDNMVDGFVAYQGYLGQLRAEHEIEVETSMYVMSNIGGLGAVLEVSRPGQEMIVQLFPDRVAVAEREAGGRLRWITTVPVRLDEECRVRVQKASVIEDPSETLRVYVDDTLIVECTGRGAGELDIGRVVFGSLGYGSMGASFWRWIDVRATTPEPGTMVDTETRSFGALKGAFAPRR